VPLCRFNRGTRLAALNRPAIVPISLIFWIFFFFACGGGHHPGIYHEAKPGDTVNKIAEIYNSSPLEIARLNNIKDPAAPLKEDTVLFIPGASHKKETPEKKKKPPTAPKKETTHVPEPVKEKETVKPEPKPHTGLAIGEKRLFIWPYRGDVTSNFGPQPNGMFYNHIRIEGQQSDPVLAAAAGTVIFSASLKDFGETIILKHERGFTTVYAHLGSRSVRVEDKVMQGKKIGTPRPLGKEGKGFIHFEIRENTKPLNPLQFLPPN